MYLLTHSAVRAVAAATLLVAFVLAGPSGATAGDHAQAVAAQPSSAH